MNLKTKWGLLALLMILMAAVFAGCGTAPVETAKVETVQAKPSESGFPVTLTDDAGKQVTIEKEPQRIISIQTSNTEIAFALGLGNKIVGVSDYCNYPEEAKSKEKVGARDMNAEKILELSPDLILVTDYHQEKHADILEQFRQAGSKVIVIGSASSFEDAYRHMRLIAKATGTEKKAEEIIAGMKTRLQAIKEKAQTITQPKKVWVEVSPAPDIFTTGKGTFLNEMLESIHAVNAAADQEGWVKFTEEQIVERMPEVIITTYGYYVENPAAGVLKREGWQEVPAIKHQQVFDVDNDTVTRPGPRLIDGVETLAKLIYPETFK